MLKRNDLFLFQHFLLLFPQTHYVYLSVAVINCNFVCLLQYIQHSPGNSRRGFGIDCAILSCQVSVCIVNEFNLCGIIDLV